MSQRDEVHQRLKRVNQLAKMMDDRFSIPGTRIRFGLDSLVGLIPGLGDSATAIAGLWLVAEAARMKVPRMTIIKMLINVGIDFVFGLIPIFGDVFDVFWKSNRKNATLLEQHLKRRSLQNPPRES